MTFGSFSKIVGKALLVSLWVGRARSKLLDWNVLNDFAPKQRRSFGVVAIGRAMGTRYFGS